MLIKELLRRDDAGEQYVDRAALKAKIAEYRGKVLSMTEADRSKQVDNVNKLISSGYAGIASLTSIEGDYEILNILRDTIALDVAEVRPLPLGTIPLFRSRSINPVGLFHGALSGGGSTNYYATKDIAVQVQPFTFGTEEVMVPNLNNIYDMEKLQQRRTGQERLDHDLGIGYNNCVVNTIFGGTYTPSSISTYDPAASIQNYASAGGSFVGKNVYALDPGVPAAAVPSVNYYDVTSQGGLTKRVFQVLRTHSIQLGVSFAKMYIPQQASGGNSPVWESLQNLATPVALVTGNGNLNPAASVPHEMWTEFQKEDYEGSIIVNWFGMTLSIERQNWLPAGYCPVFTNRPSCLVWDRLNLQTGGETDGTLETPVNAFYSKLSKAKQIATARPDYALKAFALIKVQ
jgi:hypothetical protein